MSATLTVVIISHNQADSLEAAILSARWANERIVLELGSTDDSLAVARHCRATVIRHWGENPLLQLDSALKSAKSDWVLWLKADEVIPEALKQEIQLAIGNGIGSGYTLNRLHSFQNMALDLNPADATIRLVRQGKWHVVAGWEPSIELKEGDAAPLSTPLYVEPLQTAGEILDMLHQESNFSAYQQISAHGKLAGSKNLTWLICKAPIVFLLSMLFGKAGKSSSGHLLSLLQALRPALTVNRIRQLLSAR